MRTFIQRVSEAHYAESSSPERPLGSIKKGIFILAGFEQNDTPVAIEQMIIKIKDLRIFSDPAGKLNLSSQEVGAEFLFTSQFTLYADCRYGNRPSFSQAAEKARAKEYYQHFVKTAERLIGEGLVKHSEFGLDLQISLTNDGPVSLWMDSKDIL